jgi:hypothetical protein
MVKMPVLAAAAASPGWDHCTESGGNAGFSPVRVRALEPRKKEMRCILSTRGCGGQVSDSRYSKANATSNTTDQSMKAAVTVGMRLHLFSIGFVGAATIILFGVASVSLLGTGKGCRISEGVFRCNVNAMPIQVQTYAPPLEFAKIPPAFPPQDASTSETSEIRGARPGFELAAPEDNASAATSESPDAALIQSAPITKTQSSKVSGSEQAATVRRPIADEASATPDASLGTVLSEISGVNRHVLSPNAAFRYRVQKECGPIIFPPLYRHCVASFGVHYR